MPMVWNAEADAKLLSAIIKVYDVKVAGEKLKEVAQIIGPDCTAKALTHRISKIRNLAKEDGAEGSDGTTPKKQKTPTKPTKPSTPAKTNGKGSKKQSASRSSTPDDDEGATPASARPKRSTPKRDYAQMAGEDSDADEDGDADSGVNKKVKVEVAEDIGEGLHEAADETSAFEFS